MRQPKVWTSLLILLVIGLHAVPVLFYQGHRQTGWPILAWAMFAKSLPPGPIQTVQRRVVGSTASGRKQLVTPRAVGMSRPALRKLYLQPMQLGDSAAAQRLLRRLNHQRDDPFVAIRIEGEQYIVSGDAVVREELPAMTFRLHRSESR